MAIRHMQSRLAQHFFREILILTLRLQLIHGCVETQATHVENTHRAPLDIGEDLWACITCVQLEDMTVLKHTYSRAVTFSELARTSGTSTLEKLAFSI